VGGQEYRFETKPRLVNPPYRGRVMPCHFYGRGTPVSTRINVGRLLLVGGILIGVASIGLFAAYSGDHGAEPEPASAQNTTAAVNPPAGLNHEVFQRLLEKHVNQNSWVDYDGLSTDRGKLNEYLRQLASAQPTSFSTDRDRLAFWIDAYNAFTLASVLDNVYGKAKGVKEVPGFFDQQRHSVAGEELTLDQIERRARDFHDPRVHFAVVCASTSCPKLQRFAYTGPDLDAQLQRAMQEFLSDPARGLRIDQQRNTVFLSSLFKWYAGDFTGKPSGAGQLFARARAYVSGGNVIEYVKQHAPPDVTRYIREKHPKVEYLDYDWSLNSIQNHPAGISSPTR
jgi:hypothetical protein